MLSHFSHVWLFVILWTIARQTPLFMGFSKQRILEWIAMPSFRGYSPPRDLTLDSWLLHWHVSSLPLASSGSPYSLSNYHYYNTVQSTTVSLLYTRCSNYSSFNWKFIFFYQPLLPSPNSPGNHFSILYFYVNSILHINDTMKFLSIPIWFISLSVIPSRFLHVLQVISTSFYFIAE